MRGWSGVVGEPVLAEAGAESFDGGGVAHAGADVGAPEEPGDLGEDPEVMARAIFGSEDRDEDVNGLTVDGVEGQSCRVDRQGSANLVHAADPTVRNRNAASHAGAGKLLSRPERVKDGLRICIANEQARKFLNRGVLVLRGES